MKTCNPWNDVSSIKLGYIMEQYQLYLEQKGYGSLIVLETDCIDLKSQKVLEYMKILYRSDKFK